MGDHISGTEPEEILEPAKRSGGSRRSERAGRAGGIGRRRPDDRSPSRRQVVTIAASSLAVLSIAVGVGAFALYDRLESNIRTVDIGQSPGSSGGDGQPMNLNPNVDFFSASAYYTMGIPLDLFTPIFAIARTSGWTAHVLEQLADNRLIRPQSVYTGPVGLKVVPIEPRNRKQTIAVSTMPKKSVSRSSSTFSRTNSE